MNRQRWLCRIHGKPVATHPIAVWTQLYKTVLAGSQGGLAEDLASETTLGHAPHAAV